MAVNESIYETKHTWATETGGYEYCKTTDGFAQIMTDNENWQANTIWDNSNVYTTYNPNKYNLNMFGSAISTIEFKLDSGFKGLTRISYSEPEEKVKVNLRYCLINSESFDYNFNMLRWTNKKTEISNADYIKANTIKYKGVYSTYDAYFEGEELYIRRNDGSGVKKDIYFVNEISRENIFLLAQITSVTFDTSGTLVSADNFTENELNDQSGDLWTKGYITLDNGDRKFISTVKVLMGRLLGKNSEKDERVYYGLYPIQNEDELKIDSPAYSLSILAERVYDNSVFYSLYIMPSFGDVSLLNRIYTDNEYHEGYMDGSPDLGYYYVYGDTEENYNTAFTFAPLGNGYYTDLRTQARKLNDEHVTYFTLYTRPSGGNIFGRRIITLEEVYRYLSCFLIPFKISPQSSSNVTLYKKNNPKMYLGIRNEETGEVEGDFIDFIWGVTETEKTFRPDDFEPYDPTEPEPDTPVTPDDDGDINIGSVPVGITNAFTNCYIMNTGAVDYAGKILWSGLGSQQAESGLTFGGMVKNFFGLFTDVKSETTDSTYRELALNTILDYFVSLRYYPIQNLFSYTQATVTDHLSVGTGQEPIVMAATGGFGVPQRRIVQMSGGQLTRAELNASGKVYNSFLDYQPNTTATLYIPYCGTVELTPSQLLDCDTIDIVYALDIMTGALSAIAMKNGTASYPLAMLQGTCGFETLVSGSNKGIVELATSISNLRFGANTSNQIVQGLANSAIGSASQNAENAEVNTQAMLIRGIASAYNAGTSMYNYLVGLPTMTGISPISAGSMSSLASTIMPQTAYIQLTKHSADIPTNFENTYGRTTNVYGSIGSYQGYLICGNPRLEGIPCTEHERDEIFSLLTTGVYVE